jgi:hypothetical protein
MAGELISTGGKGLGHLLDANRQVFLVSRIFAVMLMDHHRRDGGRGAVWSARPAGPQQTGSPPDDLTRDG